MVPQQTTNGPAVDLPLAGKDRTVTQLFAEAMVLGVRENQSAEKLNEAVCAWVERLEEAGIRLIAYARPKDVAKTVVNCLQEPYRSEAWKYLNANPQQAQFVSEWLGKFLPQLRYGYEQLKAGKPLLKSV